MNQDERIAQLEQEILNLKNAFRDYAQIAQHVGGRSLIYESAVDAIIASHPRPDLLKPALDDFLARTEADIVHQSEVEDHLRGAQEGQAHLLEELRRALNRFHRS